MKAYNNIACKQVNFDGNNRDYYLSDNVYFRGKKINSIKFFTASGGATVATPFDGGTLMDDSLLQNLYITLVNDNKDVLVQNCPVLQFMLMSNKQNPVDSKISFTMSYLSYKGNPSDLTGKSILMYVSWDEEQRPDDFDNTISKSVSFTYSGQAVKLRVSDFLDEWITRSDCTVFRVAVEGSSCYVSLRERSGRVFECVPSQRLYPLYNAGLLTDQFVLSAFDIDFKNSWIIPATTTIPYKLKITFYYA